MIGFQKKPLRLSIEIPNRVRYKKKKSEKTIYKYLFMNFYDKLVRWSKFLRNHFFW